MSQAVLRVESLSKTYPGTRALSDVSLEIRPQEIHALVGQNGSGKSTLIKTLAGYHRADPGGQIWLHGEPFDPADLTDERHGRLRFVHQELGLILELSAADNLALLGKFHRHRRIAWLPGRIHWAAQRRATRAALAQFGVEIDVDAPLSEATPVERTVVAISAALQGWEGGAGVLVLDEPTAVLPAHEVVRLLEVVREVRRRGTSVLYVSHRLDELFGLAERVSVLRGGQLVATRDIGDLDKEQLASLMVGAAIDINYRTHVESRPDEPVVCELRDVSGRELRDVSFTIRRGEVLGVAGLPGSGVRELPYAMVGALGHRTSGWIRMPHRSTEWKPIAEAASLRLPIVPADRRTESVITPFTVGENMTLRTLERLRRRTALSSERERECVTSWSRQMQVEPPDSAPLPITTLSGGNQQKVILARCLAPEPEILVMCEPTAGVDIRTRRALYELIAVQAAKGLAVVVSSIDIGDLLAMCTRVLVLSRGGIVESLADETLTEERLVRAMEGGE